MSFHRTTQPAHRPRGSSSRLDLESFTTHLTLAVAQSRATGRASHALLTIDLDGFTRIHASFGAAAADRLLVTVGHRLLECLGQDDHMARVGSDEFNALIECDGNAADAWRVAELMLHRFKAPFALEDREVAITACVGVALVQPDHRSAAEVIRDANAAVHRARNEGAAHCAIFDDGKHEATISELRLAADLRHAIDRGEFRMYYQPIHDCASERPFSMEALIRWQHPIRGTLLPGEFLAALERSGLLVEVGRWIISEVCRQAVEWRDVAGLRIPIAINISPRQLIDPEFVTHLRAVIHQSGACPESIAFEVTEEIELGEGEAALRILREIRSAGFEVRLDDFGTGYSSLSYLQRLPLDGLKLDRSFIHYLDHDARRQAIVSAIIQLAHALQLDVIAEGVERREQLEVLRSLGCDRVQGYLLSRALPGADARHWLEQHR